MGGGFAKTITEAMLGRHETVLDPGSITIEDLLFAATRVMLASGYHEEGPES